MRATRKRQRRGAATVELSVCLPVFVLVVVGTIETCTLIHLKESLSVASYEAARLAVQGSDKRQLAIDSAQQIMTARRINNSVVDIQPTDLASIQPGESITVTVSVPAGTQSYLPAQFFGDMLISAQTVMMKEKK